MITEMFTTKQEIENFLKTCKYEIADYIVHDDLTVEFFDRRLEILNVDMKLVPFKYINVEEVFIHNTGIESLESLNLAREVKIIHVSNCPLKSTKGLPNTVEKIRLSNTLVEYFEGFPEGMKEIYVNDSPLKTTKGIPKTVTFVSMVRTKVVRFEGMSTGCKVVV
jgi:hypothetical protein